MRKATLWLLVLVLALSGLSFAASAEELTSINGYDVVNTGTDVYMAIPNASGNGEMFVRVPLDGASQAVCLDRAESFKNVLPFAGGAMYQKDQNGSSAVMIGKDNETDSLYGFGSKTVTDLAVYNDDMLVLDNGLLYSIDPNTQVCLKLSSAQMLDYVLGDDCAYYLSGSDRMEYTANLDDGGTTKAQGGCLYRLDLKTGETTLLLKSGAEDLKLGGHNLFFHNLAEAYALRSGDETVLHGKLNSLDAQMKVLNGVNDGPDGGFWPLGDNAAFLADGVIKINNGGEAAELYAPSSDAVIGTDGESLYVWEPQLDTLTNVSAEGTTNVLYTGDLAAATDASLLVPTPSPEPLIPEDGELEADIADGDEAEGDDASAGWFDNYVSTMDGEDNSTKPGTASTASSGVTPQPTPLAGVAVKAEEYDEDEDGEISPSSSSGSSSSKSSGSSSSSSGSSSSGSYKSGKYVKVVNGDANIRSGPSKNYKKKTVVTKGQTITFKNRVSTDSRGVKWYKVSVNGTTGWISSKYAKVTNTKSSSSSSSSSGSSSGKHVKTTGKCKIRSGASKSSKIIGYMGSGKTASYISSKKDSRGVTWYKVKYKGKTGWVSSRYSKRVS